MSNINLSFFDIQALPVNQDIKDELTLAFLHGLDLTHYTKKYRLDFKTLRGVRLCLEHDVPVSLIDNNLSESTLLCLSDIYASKRTIESTGLDFYFKQGYLRLMIEEETFKQLTKLALKDISIKGVDFNLVPVRHVPLFVSALMQGIPAGDLVTVSLSKDEDYMEFLLSLRQAGIDVRPFLHGNWSEDQIQAVILGRMRISPEELISSYINENFTAGQIEYALKSLDYGCESVVCSLDEDGYPIYNEYQMYNIVEGARFGLDYMSYANPSLNDYQMATSRNQLILQKERMERGAVSSHLSLR